MFKKINTQRYRHEKLWDFIKTSPNNIENNFKVLDVGCGKGWFLETIFKGGVKNLYGCDFVKNLDFENFKFELVDFNKQELPYNDEEFDMVICSDVLEHIENPSQLLRDIRRVIKPNGFIFITIPNCANILQRIYFLFLGNTKRFNPKPSEVAPHISMTPSWIFNYLIKDLFEIVRIGGDRFIICSYALTFLPSTSLFSFTTFMELKPNIR